MSEIKVGEYVRTKKDGICKLLQIDKDNMWSGYVDKPFWLRKDNIVKHSSNIIDLIEVGDYVNGSEVVAEKYTKYDMDFINVDSEISFGWGYGVIPEKDIKTIVTKEQFDSMEYRLEE